MKNILIILVTVILFSSCDDLFSPAIENNRDREQMHEDPTYALGILLNGYTRIPSGGWSFSDVATDDAVSNDQNNSYRKIATGQWAANNNPTDQWTNAFAAIQYMNIMLEESDKVNWADDEDLKRLFNDRTKGEAYGLRALFMYYLLQAHGGWTEGGELLGVPILTASQGEGSDFNQPRATFEKCMEQLNDDLDKAEELLPLDFEDVGSDAEVPAQYPGISKDNYNRVFGAYSRLRITKRITEAIRTQAALLAASPAFSEGTSTTWQDVANYAAKVLNRIGGVNGIDPNGWTWYDNRSEIDNLKEGVNPKEILWRNNTGDSRSLEEEHYPPTLYGKGRLNPTQNLVDAFPMLNGYPIADISSSGFDAKNPYENRDPRLKRYIVVHNSKMGPAGETIDILTSSTNDGVNHTETSTRTGYYMRKLLREDVNLNPIMINQQRHYIPHIRYTEMYLIYAEAANEAWGPTGTGQHGFSAYDVIKVIRQRAGVGRDNGDPYLESIKNDKTRMQEMIRNERRLELCFEGFRFWDLRRWKVETRILTETAKGIMNTNYNPITVENRLYKEHMFYGPIPYEEVMKWDELIQNKGWK